MNSSIDQIKKYIENLGEYQDSWRISKAMFLDELKEIVKRAEAINENSSISEIQASAINLDRAIGMLRFIDPK